MIIVTFSQWIGLVGQLMKEHPALMMDQVLGEYYGAKFDQKDINHFLITFKDSKVETFFRLKYL